MRQSAAQGFANRYHCLATVATQGNAGIYIEHKYKLYLLAILLAAAGYLLASTLLVPALAVLAGAIILLPGLASEPPVRIHESGVPEPSHDPALVGLEAFEDAAMIVSARGTLTATNAAATDLFGRAVGEDVRLALRHPGALDALERSMREHREVIREIEGLGRQAAVFRLRCSPLGDDRTLVNFVDVSQQRASERMRADFVANASHELRTPLATVSGFIETLQGPAADDAPARDRFLGLMAGEAARMTRLIDDLLSLSRIELDKTLRPRERIDVGALIEEFAEDNVPMAESREHAIDVKVEAGLPDILADRDQLLQVLVNLVSNAFKYSRAGSTVHIGAASAEEGVTVSVRDDGDGIEPEHLPRLTERFYRVDTGRSRRLGGTGLGLAIVKHIVERHRGRLEIRSVVGKGTTVSVILPAAPMVGP